MAPYGGVGSVPARTTAWQADSSSAALPDLRLASQYSGRPSLPMRREMVTMPEAPAGGCHAGSTLTRTSPAYPPAVSAPAMRGIPVGSAMPGRAEHSMNPKAASRRIIDLGIVRSGIFLAC